jgi:drug/metabolite transporter (DMT)-like permease
MSTTGKGSGTKHAAGAFDVRNVIAALIGFYGVVLVVMGVVDNGADALKKTDGVNANLWVGICMLVFALAFLAWTRLRPIVVEAPADADDD